VWSNPFTSSYSTNNADSAQKLVLQSVVDRLSTTPPSSSILSFDSINYIMELNEEIRRFDAAKRIQTFLRPILQEELYWRNFDFNVEDMSITFSDIDIHELDNMFGSEYPSDITGDGPSLITVSLCLATFVLSFLFAYYLTIRALALPSQSKEQRRRDYERRMKNSDKVVDKKTKNLSVQIANDAQSKRAKNLKKFEKMNHYKNLQSQSLPIHFYDEIRSFLIASFYSLPSLKTFSSLSSLYSIEVREFLTSTYTRFLELFNEHSLRIPSLTELFESFSFDLKDLAALKRSRTITDLSEIFTMLATAGLMTITEPKIWGIHLFSLPRVRHEVTLFEIMTSISSYLYYLSLCTFACFTGTGLRAFWSDALENTYEDTYAMLVAKAKMLPTGHLDMDRNLYDQTLNELTEKTVELLITAKGSEKTTLTRYLQTLRGIRVQLIQATKESERPAPFGLSFHGGTSRGKSSNSYAITRFLLASNGFPSTNDYIVTIDDADKFESTVESHHLAYMLDDVGNSKVEYTTENPLARIIRIINNSPATALSPEADKKGKIPMNPAFAVITTNVKTLNAEIYSNEPASITRRMLHIECKVKPQFQQYGNTMLDVTKIDRTELFPTYGLYTVEYSQKNPDAESTGQKGVVPDFHTCTFEGNKLVDIEIGTLLRFLKIESAKHFAQQDDYVNIRRNKDPVVLCACGIPTTVCDTCNILDSQSMSDKFAQVPEAIYTFEAHFIAFLNARIQSFFSTRIGLYVLYYLNAVTVHHMLILSAMYTFILTVIMLACEKLNQGHVLYVPWLRATVLGVIFILTHLIYKLVCFKQHITSRYIIPKPSTIWSSYDQAKKNRIVAALGGMATIIVVAKLFLARRSTIPSHNDPDTEFEVVESAQTSERHRAFWDKTSPLEERKPAAVTRVSATTSSDNLRELAKRKLYNADFQLPNAVQTVITFPLKQDYLLIPNHCVPKKVTRVVLHRGNHRVNATISAATVRRIPGTDFAIWYCPETGTQRDMVQYLPLTYPSDRKSQGWMVSPTQDFMPSHYTPATVRTSHGGTFTGFTSYCEEGTRNGLCGAPIVALTPRPAIIGFHLGGKDKHAGAGLLLQPQVEATIEAMMQSDLSMLASHNHSTIPSSIGGIPVTLGAVHFKSAVADLTGDAVCEVYGDHDKPRATSMSNVVRSAISKDAEEIMGLPAVHGRPYKMNDPMHKEKDLSNKTDPVWDVDHSLLQKAAKDYHVKVFGAIPKSDLANLGKIDLDANLSGLDGEIGINAMNFATSCGFPFKGKKHQFVEESARFIDGITKVRDLDPYIIDLYHEAIAKLSSGERLMTIFKGALKDEATSMDKKKVRVFAACNIVFTLIVRTYFLKLSALIQKHQIPFECAVGVNVAGPDWTELQHAIRKYGADRVIAGDYAAFDGRMPARFMMAAFRLLIDLAEASGNYSEIDLVVMRGIATEISFPIYDHFGTIIGFHGSNPSGHPLTVVINSIVNSLYMRYVYFKIARDDRWLRVPAFDSVVSLLTYGDDNVMSVKRGYKQYNHSRIAQEFASMGITYTMAEKTAESIPYIHADEASFLKHTPVWDEERGLFRAEIELKSIQKMLHCHLKSDVLTREESSVEAMKNVADKFFQFGRSVYTARREELHEVAIATGLKSVLGELKSYDEHLAAYDEKYVLDSQNLSYYGTLRSA
jgi:hypothetical protein